MEDKVLRNEKKSLREEMRSKRRFMTTETIVEYSSEIYKRAIEQIGDAKEVCIFLSAFKEPDTFIIIDELWKRGIKVAVPISNTDTLELTLSYIESKADLERGAYGIYEPTVIKEASEKDMDVIFVPGLAFDRNGGRMGFGKGYYDKLLQNGKGKKIGLCYDFQLFDSIPTQSHDVPMDCIITEKETIEIRRK